MPKFEARAVRYMTDLIRDFKLQPFQAAGFPGNFGVETGGFEHVQEIDPVSGGRGGLGDAQWTGMNSRRGEFEAWLARRRTMGLSFDPADYDANYSMVFRELDGAEGRRVLPKLRQAGTVDEATEIVMREYERPGVEHLERRKEYGRQALAAFNAEVSAGRINVQALLAQGRPAGDTPEQPRNEPMILPPLASGQIDLNQILAVGLPLLLQALANRQAPAPGGATPQQPDIVALLAQLLGQPKPPPPVVEQPKPAEPPPVIVKSEPKTSVGLGLLGLFGSILGISTGTVGTPFGMGEDPTTAGTLSIVIPAAISAIGATGIFGPFGAILGRIAGAAFSAAKAPKS